MLTVVDLFAGAGGLSSSLEAEGWKTLAAVDNDPDAIMTLRANQARGWLKGARVIQADVRDLTGRDLVEGGTRLDLLTGGPPCQPFSSAGLMRAVKDPRGTLFRDFVRIAKDLSPRFILFENVAGLVTAKTPDGKAGGVLSLIQMNFENIGYACRFELLNAADFGAAQRRVRLYMIAAKQETIPEFPSQTHDRLGAEGRRPWRTLKELLDELPAPDPSDVVYPSESRLADLLALKPGTGLRSTGIVEANRPSGHWGYRQDCFVADLELPSRTIRAASTPDWVRCSDGKLRRLTWKECAALQGFSQGWEFFGTKAALFRQIGNAVQGEVGRALARRLAVSANSLCRANPRSAPWPAAFHRRVRYTDMEEQTNGAHRRAARRENDAFSA